MLLSIVISSLYAQVGINTTNAISIFNVDGENNNPTSGTSSASEQLDDFVIKADGSGGVNVGIGVIPSAQNNTQLELGSPNRAFVYNRVALTSVIDKTTVLNPTEGMIVFNTATDGVYPDAVIPGLYYFNGQVWFRIETLNFNDPALKMYDLQTDYTVPLLGVGGDPSVPPAGTLPLDFGTTDIEINKEGTYAFSLRLYGRVVYVVPSTIMQRSEFYVYLIRKDAITSIETVMDFAQINVPTYPSPYPTPPVANAMGMTYTTTLGCKANVGDKIYIKAGGAVGNLEWILYAQPDRAAKTSMIYWKI